MAAMATILAMLAAASIALPFFVDSDARALDPELPFRAVAPAIARDEPTPPSSLVPPGLQYAVLAWDTVNDELLLQGGNDGVPYGALWSYSPLNNSWSNLESSPGPARFQHSAVWDQRRGWLIFFGGLVDDQLKNDLWAYDVRLKSWRELPAPGRRPSPRRAAVLVLDSDSSQLILFGGDRLSAPINLGDTWIYRIDDSTWTEVSPAAGSPSPRQGMSAAWDPVRKRLLMYGGWDFVPETNQFREMWAFDPAAKTWTLLHRGSGPGDPPGLFRNGAVWDSTSQRFLMFGGCCDRPGFNDDVWAFDPAANRWESLHPTTPKPPGRNRNTVAWDPARSRLLTFGSLGNCPQMNDLWAFETGSRTWTRLGPVPGDGAPLKLMGHSAVVDASANNMLVFGGCDGSSVQATLWSLDLGSLRWSKVETGATGPGPRAEHAVAWDAVGRTMYLFGGAGTETRLGDFWAFDAVTRNWTQLPSGIGAPGARSQARIAWDDVHGQLLLFGGVDPGGRNLGDLWSYKPALGRWEVVQANPGPPKRTGFQAGWDPVSRQFVLYGGFDFVVVGEKFAYNDTWVFDPATNQWRQLSSTGILGDEEHRAGTDIVVPATGSPGILFGGLRDKGITEMRNDVWLVDTATGAWGKATTTGGPPSPRSLHSMAWDPAHGRLLVFGGYGGGYLGDTWAYSPATSTWSLLDRGLVAPLLR